MPLLPFPKLQTGLLLNCMALDIDSVEEQANIENLDDGEDDFADVLALDIDTAEASNETLELAVQVVGL